MKVEAPAKSTAEPVLPTIEAKPEVKETPAKAGNAHFDHVRFAGEEEEYQEVMPLGGVE